MIRPRWSGKITNPHGAASIFQDLLDVTDKTNPQKAAPAAEPAQDEAEAPVKRDKELQWAAAPIHCTGLPSQEGLRNSECIMTVLTAASAPGCTIFKDLS